jgi:hypothetical protein
MYVVLAVQFLSRRNGRGAEVFHLLGWPERQAEVVPAGEPQGSGRGVQGLSLTLPPPRQAIHPNFVRAGQCYKPKRPIFMFFTRFWFFCRIQISDLIIQNRYRLTIFCHGGSVADSGCLSRILDPKFSIPDPRSEFCPSRIPDPGSVSKNLKSFLSPRKYDPGCSSRIRISDPDPYFFTHPGSRGSKRHRIPNPDPQHCIWDLQVSRCRLQPLTYKSAAKFNSSKH